MDGFCILKESNRTSEGLRVSDNVREPVLGRFSSLNQQNLNHPIAIGELTQELDNFIFRPELAKRLDSESRYKREGNGGSHGAIPSRQSTSVQDEYRGGICRREAEVSFGPIV
jgi:hypothetical protein